MNAAEAAYVEELKSENLELESEVFLLRTQVAEATEQLAWLKRQLFGKRSEKVIEKRDERQLLLFDLDGLQKPKEEETKKVAAHSRKKPNRNGQDAIALPADIPLKTTVIDLPEEEKVCKETGEKLVQIGEEVSHKLAHQPGSYYIKEIIRPKYALPKREEAGIFTASLPGSLLLRCRADESFLAEIITKKFADHLPLYRIEEILKREEIKVSRKLLSQWVIRCGQALKPLYEVMLKRILASRNIFIDEMPIKLQNKVKCRQGYLWVLVGGKDANPPYRVYDFRPTRNHQHAFDLLKDYRGGLHSDKYGAYQKMAERKLITWHPCFSHIRRKFFEAEAGDPEFRKWVLRKIRYLFMLERVGWARPADERLRIRKEKELPILEELIQKVKLRLSEGKLLPKSKFREALCYFLGLVPYLRNYIDDPYARLDNNVAERALRPLAIGRKNWLFFGSLDGADAGAVLFSLVQTCRGLGINPREYLEDVMRRIMDHNSQKLHELLPDEWLAARQKPQSP
jgi:transposase